MMLFNLPSLLKVTDASKIVKIIGDKDLKLLKNLEIECNRKDALVSLALKLSKNKL